MAVKPKRGRPSGEKTRCSGKWTEARYKSFITGNLRRSTQKWAPIQECKRDARTRRGMYRCAGCEEEVTPTRREGSKRVKNIHVDHINPIVDPAKGFTTWDEYIDRMFCEKENLQLLCSACHDVKTNKEKEIASIRRKKEKLNG